MYCVNLIKTSLKLLILATFVTAECFQHGTCPAPQTRALQVGVININFFCGNEAIIPLKVTRVLLQIMLLTCKYPVGILEFTCSPGEMDQNFCHAFEY